MTWFLKILKTFFFSLDNTLFNFIKSLYDILMSIANSSILSQGDISVFVSRVELLLGVFMLFRVSISLITYLINPDSLSDTSKGFGKLIQNTILSLAMLVLVPYAFQMAFQLQSQIIGDNILAKVIFGEDGGEEYLTTAGEELAFYTLQPFFKPNTSIYGLEDCAQLFDEDGFNDDCEAALLSISEDSNDFTETDVENYKYGMDNHSLSLTFRLPAATATYKGSDDKENFVFDYPWPISTVAGVVVCLLLISFCMDIGLRSVKLAFLQLIYPIPVIAFMDPKSGKDGVFKKWYKMCFSTYISLFVRLLALFFGLFIIQRVGELGIYDILNGSQNTNGFVFVFVIIGVLMFAKQLPKILENFGLKLDGDGKFTLNPIKKFTENAAGGKQLVGVPLGAAMGLGIGAVGTASGAGKGKWFTGMMSGIGQGLQGKKLGEMHKNQIEANQRMREAIASGSKFRGRMGARFGSFIGSGGESASLDAQDKKLETQLKTKEEAHKAFDDLKSQLASNIKGGKAPKWILDRRDQKRIAVESAKARKDAIKEDDFYEDKVDILNGKKERVLNREKYQAALDAASAEIVKAENALGKYENKDAVQEYYDMYRGTLYDDDGKEVSMKQEDRDKVAKKFEAFDQVASQQGYGDMSTYDAADKKDTEIGYRIEDINRDRQKIREQKDIAAANKAAVKR